MSFSHTRPLSQGGGADEGAEGAGGGAGVRRKRAERVDKDTQDRYKTDLCTYVQAYVTTLPQGSEVSLSTLGPKLLAHYKNNEVVKQRLEAIFRWFKRTGNPGLQNVLLGGKFVCRGEPDHKLIVP